MSPKMNWNNIHIDYIEPNGSFDIFRDEDLRDEYNWKNIQPLIKIHSL